MYDENYLALPKLSEVQYKFIEAMTDISPESRYTEGICVWGKGCVDKDTLIETDKGEQKISAINNDFVCLSYDENKNGTVWTYAKKPFFKEKEVAYKITLDGDRQIVVTSNHKFFTKMGWETVGKLLTGDLILSYASIWPAENEGILGIGWARIFSIQNVGEKEIWDFEVPVYQNYLAQGFVNHNSGKDFCSGISIARIMYQLLCMKNPQAEFKMSEDSFIDAVNIAVNASQASHVFFQPFRNMINRAKIFQKLGFDDKQNEILFPKNLRAISGHSDQEGLEGYNLIFAVLDEIAAFPMADNLEGSRILRARDANTIYNAIRASVQSRFPGRGKIVSLSFPRYKGDFIMSLAEKRKNDEKTYVSSGIPTWVANPIRKREDFDDEYSKNPDVARGKYECLPPDSDEPYFRDSYLINSLFENASYGSGLEAFNNIQPESFSKYCIHIDLGLKQDSAGIAMAHSIDNNVVVVDFAFAISPSGYSQEINFGEIQQCIFSLKARGFRIEKVTLDHFSSQGIIQVLKQNKISCENLSTDKNTSVYDTLKELIYSKRIIFRFVEPLLVKELLGLRLVRASKIDHLPGGGFSKDCSDAVAGAVCNAVQFPRFRKHIELGNIGAILKTEERKNLKNSFGLPTVIKPKVNSPETCIFCGKRGNIEQVSEDERRCNWCFVIQEKK